ncbi:hypothetical protein O23A_p2619 [Aeromonas salmonicida]|nr:hypothetical protein O23A_p2619 [Aeromonas salmonicida]
MNMLWTHFGFGNKQIGPIFVGGIVKYCPDYGMFNAGWEF